jgi:hypothetical protein
MGLDRLHLGVSLGHEANKTTVPNPPPTFNAILAQRGGWPSRGQRL